MKVLYLNNCWFTNVGEAFIDVGGMELTKRIFGEDLQLACFSAMTNYYVKNAPNMKNRLFSNKVLPPSIEFEIVDYLNADYVIIPGMVGTVEFLNAYSRKMVDKLVEKGCKPIFLGLGGLYYDETEVEAIKRYFDQIKPALITTRDNDVYEFYKDVAPCIKSIDCAFWSVDAFDPRGFVSNDYDVVTFNRIAEPECFKSMEKVVRPWHMQYEFRKENTNKTLMISDTPYDYLTLYANANKVYTDLVHATIVSLMYGTPVKYWENGKRYKAFYALDDLYTKDDFLFVQEESLKRQKQSVIEKIKTVL